MNQANALSRQGQRLLQVGIALTILVALEGFAIPAFASPRIGLSVHTLGTFGSLQFVTLGLLWPRLRLGRRAGAIAFWTLLYSIVATLAAYLIAATWGVGIESIPLMGELPHGLSHGTAFQENVIRGVEYSAGLPVFTAWVLVLWGVRGARGDGDRPQNA